jgi:chromosome segregation protein
MAAHLVRIRISGFKSFADPVTLDVLPGLTGLVGPNGCGKSNLAEALRWAMGEANARALRSNALDGLIFASTRTRPGREAAEVALTLAGQGFPVPFAGEAWLQVALHIARGQGTSCEVNGEAVRARDVRALFADLAGGARSSAMVGQGQVAALVAARPEERRGLLEQAAGLAGLHARREEAEARLRAAEANLARAADRSAVLDGQLDGLRRQAGQAARHAELLTRIAAAEAGLHALARALAAAARDAGAAALAAAQAAAADAASLASIAGSEAEAAAAALPNLRDAETEARTAAERARLREQERQAAAGRARDALAAAAARYGQAARDLADAEAAVGEATRIEAGLAEEAGHLAEETAAAPARLAALQADAAAATRGLADAEVIAAAAAGRAAALATEARARGEVLAQAEARSRRASEAAARLGAERARAARSAVDPARLVAASAEADASARALADSAAQLGVAMAGVAQAAASAAAAREAEHRAEAACTHLAAEAGALAEVLAGVDGERWPPVLDGLQVPAGLEAALAAALGDDLLAAAADPGAPRHWRSLPPLPVPGPPVGTPLSDLVQAPPALARGLSGIGLVADEGEGDAAQPELLPGQCLVSREGALWRWDGYTVRAGTPAPAATRLRQRRRFAVLQAELREAEAVLAEVRSASAAAAEARRAAVAADAQARAAQRAAETRAGQARQAAAALQARGTVAAAALAGLDAQLAALAPEADEAATALDEARTAHAALPEPGQLDVEAVQARAVLAAARARDAAASRALDDDVRDGQARQARLEVLAQERAAWAARAAGAAQRVAGLRARLAEAEAEHARLSTAVAGLAGTVGQGASGVPEAEAGLGAAAAALVDAERHAATRVQAARSADAELAQVRETLIRAEAAAGQAEQAWHALPPAPDAPGVSTLSDLSTTAEARARAGLARLQRERDALGSVNPRAADEAAALAAEVQAAARERAEVAAAAAGLRGSLGGLDQEARSRLLAVFDQVDRHFQALFRRMFGGGQAHLALAGSDDPLQAGLEVQVQPPGKRLASLALLSGGEQALTALCLVLAVFRCNPAPVCVLDEVDAALDDANVERLCSLLADMAQGGAGEEPGGSGQGGGTRFLVVTHHGLTMARMDRLYGVTMQEPGVSRLLSVDLGQAAAWSGDRAA